MRLNDLNLGDELSKDEQKNIKGGTPLCGEGYYAQCFCNDGTTILVPGSNPAETTATLCGYPYTGGGACSAHGGVRQPGNCIGGD